MSRGELLELLQTERVEEWNKLREEDPTYADVLSLPEVDLANKNLAGANLKDVDFSEADFTGADLSGADFSGAFLEKVNFTGASLDGARGLAKAQWSGAIVEPEARAAILAAINKSLRDPE